MLKNMKFNIQTFTSVIATIIAVCSLFVAYWQIISSREHNELSVRPVLSFVFHSTGTSDIGLKIKNIGNGPAIISKIEYSIDDGKVKDIHNSKDFDNMLKVLSLDKQWFDHSFFVACQGMITGEDYWVVKLTKGGDAQENNEHSEELRKALNRLTLKLYYKGIYDDEFLVSFEGIKWLNNK